MGVLDAVALDCAFGDHHHGSGPLVGEVVTDGLVCRVEAHLEADGVGDASVVDGLGLRQCFVEEEGLRLFGEDGDTGLGGAFDLAAVLIGRHGEPDDIDLAGCDHVVGGREE